MSALITSAAITTIGGTIAANQANKTAGAAGAAAGALYDSNMSRLNDFNESQKQLYGPLEQNLVQEASSDQPLYYGQMAGQINAGTAAQERGLDTQMAARGLTGSGLQAGGIQGLEMGKQGTLANAFQTGLQMRTALGQSVLQRYQPLFTQQLMSGATTQAANFNQNQQMLYGNAAAQGWGNVAKGIGAGVTALGNMQQPSPDLGGMPASTVPGVSNPYGTYTPGVGIPSSGAGIPIAPGMTTEDYGSRFMPGNSAPLSNNLNPMPNYNSTLGVGGQSPVNGLNLIPKFQVSGNSTTSVR